MSLGSAWSLLLTVSHGWEGYLGPWSCSLKFTAAFLIGQVAGIWSGSFTSGLQVVFGSCWIRLNPHRSPSDLFKVLFHPALLLSYSNAWVYYCVVSCLYLDFSCRIAVTFFEENRAELKLPAEAFEQACLCIWLCLLHVKEKVWQHLCFGVSLQLLSWNVLFWETLPTLSGGRGI